MRLNALMIAVALHMGSGLPSAQSQAVDAAARRASTTVAGIVVGVDGRPLEGSEVHLETRAVVADANGAFRFDNVPPGTYTVSALRVGFRAESRTVIVGRENVSLNFTLRPISLAPLVVLAVRTGLSGIVSDTAFRPLRGATVDLLGGQARATTDSSGAFHLDIQPGQYMVRITLSGYRTEFLSVRIPPNAGREVAVWMTRSEVGSTAREKAAVFDLERRLAKRNPVWSGVFTREDMLNTGFTDLNQIAALTLGGAPITGGACFVYIDGGPQKEALWTISTASVEFFEVYMQKPSPRTRSRNRGASPLRVDGDLDLPVPACGPVTMIAWLRK